MPTFGSAEWLAAYCDAINSSDRYKELSADWEGDIAYVIEPEPDAGLDSTTYMWVDLWHGACRDARLVQAEEAEKARYLIRAPYSAWKEVVRGRLDPIKGMREGKLKLKGDLSVLAQRAQSASELVALAQKVATEFPDEK